MNTVAMLADDSHIVRQHCGLSAIESMLFELIKVLHKRSQRTICGRFRI